MCNGDDGDCGGTRSELKRKGRTKKGKTGMDSNEQGTEGRKKGRKEGRNATEGMAQNPMGWE